MKIALTIAGSDPTGGAGLQADLKAFHSFGVHGLSVPSVLTAQSTLGVDDIFPLDASVIRGQLDILLSDIRPHALKTGMLFSKDAIEVVCHAIKAHHLTNLVIDPVTVSSSGRSLIESDAMEALRELLLPLARVITPNIYEASVLTGLSVTDVQSMKEAAQVLFDAGPSVVIVTGGHLGTQAIDVYYDGEHFHTMEADLLPGEYHGTGCTFSAAMTAQLALGNSPLVALQEAKQYVLNSIEHAFRPGAGMSILRH